MSTSFWLLVSFFIFVFFITLKLRLVIKNAIQNYKKTIISTIEEPEKNRIKAAETLQNAIQKQEEIKKMIASIEEIQKSEISKIENNTKIAIKEIEEYSSKNLHNQIQIYTLKRIAMFKEDTANHAVKLTIQYLASTANVNISENSIKNLEKTTLNTKNV